MPDPDPNANAGPGPGPGPEAILADLLARRDGLIAVETWGETALFLNPGRRLPRGVYCATLKTRDGANDRASRLSRPGVFRLSLGLPRPLYLARFGPPPPRPPKGGTIAGGWPFAELDRLTPHPVYGWMVWAAVLNPSGETFKDLSPLIEAALDKAETALARRLRAR